MSIPTIFVDDSVGALLGFTSPVEHLRDFLSPEFVAEASEFVSYGDGRTLPVGLKDASGNDVDGILLVGRSGTARFVSVQIISPLQSHFVESGALADGTVVWSIDVATSQICVEHKTGPADELVSFTTDFSHWLQSVHELDRPIAEAQFNACILEGGIIHLTVRVVRPNGEVRWIEAFGRAMQRDGITIEVAGLSIDVTTRVAEFQALANESARLEFALDASSMGIWEWDIQANRVTWSQQVADIFGVSLDEFAGTLEGFTSFVHPDDAVLVESNIANFLDGDSSGYLIDNRIVRLDGQVRWIEGRGSLTRDQTGAPAILMGTVWDSTAQRTERQRIREMEMELVRASSRLKLASEAAGIGLWEVNLNTLMATWDGQMCRLWGMEQEGYVGPCTVWEDAVHPDDSDSFQDLLQGVVDGHAATSFRVLFADGSVRHITSFARIVTESGRAPRLIGLCMDVTERRESELREGNRNRALEALVSTAPVQEVLRVLAQALEEEEAHSRFGFMVVDASGRHLENGAAPSMPDVYLDAIQGVEIREGVGSCGSAAALHEAVIVEDVRVHPYWADYRELAAAAGFQSSWSIPVIGPNNHLFGTLAMYSQAPRLRDDQLIRRMTAAADFAALAIARKNSEVAARNREMLLQSMGEIAVMGGWEMDLRSDTRSWTDELYRIHDFEVLGDIPSALELYTAESRAKLTEAMTRAVEKGEPWTLELELTTKKGRHVWLRSDGRAQIIDGRVVRIFGSAQDITAQKLAEIQYRTLQEQLLHAQKMESIGRLAGGVAHDFNNIVSVILGHAELAMETAPEGSSLMEDLSEIRQAAERSAMLTQQLLAFARKQPMSPVLVNVNDTIANMVNMLRRLIGGKISLSWDADPELWSIFVDPAQIDQILANLCVNARDAIGGRGTVRISTRNVVVSEDVAKQISDFDPGSYICLSVIDDGGGIPREVLENIFEPFFTTKGIGMGTGLGLATVYGIVKQNGGGIVVESRPGATRFDLYFPRAVEALIPSFEETLSRKRDRAVSRVLVVDDEPTVLKVTTRMLEGLGHEVRAALGPNEALRIAAETEHIDVLLTDVIMPEMNGKELSLLLEAIHPDLAVILMSGYTAEVLKDEGVFQETYFLQKPFSLNELSEVVTQALNPV